MANVKEAVKKSKLLMITNEPEIGFENFMQNNFVF